MGALLTHEGQSAANLGMTYHWLVPLIAAVLNGALGAVVLRYNPRHPLNRLFALLSLTLVFWHLDIFVLYYVHDAQSALYWSDVFRVGTLMAPAVAAHMLLVFSESRSRPLWILLGIAYALAIFLVLANAAGLLVEDLRTYSWGYYPIGTDLYRLIFVSTAFDLSLLMWILIDVVRTSESPRKRQQAKLWIVGSGIAIPLGMTNLIATSGIPFYPLGNLANVVYAGVVAYGMLRYRLMDIDIVIRKSGAYSLVTLLLIVPAFAVAVWMQARAFGRVDVDFSAGLGLLLVLVAVLFPMLRTQTESRLEESLFREKHEYRGILQEFTRSIVRILDREKLIRQLTSTLLETLQLDRVAIALRDDVKNSLSVDYTLGVAAALAEFPLQHGLVRALEGHQEAVLRDELEVSPNAWERTEAADACRINGWEVCIPLFAGGKLIGFMSLGRKRSMDAFFAEDLELLAMLAAEASVALENARLYEELKKSQDIIRRADRLSALGTLAAGIAHEIRNPLVSIQTFFQLAPQRLNDHEFLTEFLRLTSGEVKRITDLITELLSFAKSPSPSMSEVSVNDVLEGVARLVEPQVRKSQIQIIRELSADLPLVRADQDQLKQVFLNVLLNAAQAMQGPGRIIVATREISHHGEQFCQVRVTDSGQGIPGELQEHIFDPFFSTKEKGTGLGLAIAHQIVTEHGGFIVVDSEVGTGTTFCIHLRPAEAKTGGLFEDPPLLAAGGRLKHW